MENILYGLEVSNYVKGAGIQYRVPVKTVSTVNITVASDLNGATVGGVVVYNGDRMLLTGENLDVNNGIYIVDGVNSRRDEDMLDGDAAGNIVTLVYSGPNAGLWRCQAVPGADIVGTNDLTFAQVNVLSQTTGDFVYANSNKTLAKIAKPGVDSFLKMTSGGVPSWFAKTSVVAAGLYTTGSPVYVNSAAPPTSGQVLTATSSTTATWQTPSVYGNYFKYAASDPESSTTGAVFVDKLVLNSGTIVAGTYRLGYSFEVSNASNAVLSLYRVLFDGVTVAEPSMEADLDYLQFGGFVVQSIAGTSTTAKIQFCAQGGTALIRKARLEFYRIS